MSLLFHVVFTDLDGTLLDHQTYDWRPAAPALELCRRRGVPVILVSSKTRAEMQPLRSALELGDPFVVENGGAVFFDRAGPRPEGSVESDGMWVWRLGEPYARLVEALKDIRRETGLPLRGFAEMEIEEISRLTGLDAPDARRAAMREYDEPFVLDSMSASDEETLNKAAGRRGLQVLSGGRFYHLQGPNDKGNAVLRLIAHYKRTYPAVVSIALGDSPNDFSMLEAVDCPVLVRSGRDFSGLKNRIPGLRRTRGSGPQGWNEAVTGLLGNMEEVDRHDGKL